MHADAATVPGVLERAALAHHGAPALVDHRGTLTYRELLAAARGTAAGLVRLGVGPGDRVAIRQPNGTAWAVASYGVLCAGATVVPLDARYTDPEAADIVERAGCALVIGPGDEFTGGDDAEVSRRMRAITPERISHVQYTSGTEGRPKGVLLRHGALVATTRTWVEITGLRASDRYPLVAPFSHIGGHKTGLLACAVAGACGLPQPALDAPTLSRAVAGGAVTFLQGPPAMYQALLDHTTAPGRVRAAVTGAASVPSALVRDLRSVLGVGTVITAYGLTEASGVCTMTRPGDDARAVAETAGRPIPGVRVRIAAGSGEILVSGAGLMAGYLDDAEATARVMGDGWLRTGDLGVLDAGGRLRVVGRLKDVIIVGGLNAYPAEIERVLLEHPAVRRAAVVGVGHEWLGEVPAAFVVGTRDESVGAFCRARLAGFKVPRLLWWVDDLPVNAAGKAARRALRAEAERRVRP
ncbi:AMP-binding protein [Actinomadura sp. DC4]|uniref:AMP-binding protein n=1 Tax=Actinomadura sp. DC4 TaxID=3055069 RepID=UPI0025B11F97|nr:AMP-binding protein [Actinomadura sp. DC4]MDN3357612.1 AMP-binding protein [Actinomadura sp. DC4]